MTLRAELFTDHTKDSEPRSTCRCLDIQICDYSPVLAMCRALIAAGHDGPLEVYRGDTLAMRIGSIRGAARFQVDESGTPILKRHAEGARLARSAPEVGPELPGDFEASRDKVEAKEATFIGVFSGVEDSGDDFREIEQISKRGISGPATVLTAEVGGSRIPDDPAALDDTPEWLNLTRRKELARLQRARSGKPPITKLDFFSDDDRTWRRKVSPNDVVAHATKLRKIRAPQVNWNQCLTCGSKFDYEIGKGWFCCSGCRTAFDKGAPAYEAPQLEALAA
jgi:hypothetical protein